MVTVDLDQLNGTINKLDNKLKDLLLEVHRQPRSHSRSTRGASTSSKRKPSPLRALEALSTPKTAPAPLPKEVPLPIGRQRRIEFGTS